MKKRTLFALSLVLAQLLAFPLTASAMELPLSENGKTHWSAPEHSAVISEDGNLDVTRVDFVHYAKGGGAVKPTKTDPGYKLMGAKWLWQEGFEINLTNAPASVSATASDAVKAAADTWDAATACTRTTGTDLFNWNAVTSTATENYGTYDGHNVIAFGPYSDQNVIAITSVWYSRTTKAIYEFDMLFNTNFSWSVSGTAGTMDLQNIATHEFGHAVGLLDIYNADYSGVTMYGYAATGETDKCTLEKPDITGLQLMYGA